MKITSKIIAIGIILAFNSCGNASKNEETKDPVTTNNPIEESKNYSISTSESVVNWSGKGVGHGHKGTINVKSSSFSMNNDIISDFEISIDMKSIIIADIADPSENLKLSNHFKNDDFFGVDKHPTSTLKIIDASDLNKVKANMTIKGVTQEITFPVTITKQNDKLVLTTKIQIDRTKFGITYSSGNFFENLGDYLIDDIIDLNITIVGN